MAIHKSLSPVSTIGRQRRRRLIAAAVLIVLLVTALWFIGVRRLQSHRAAYSTTLKQQLDATNTQFRLFLAPIYSQLKALYAWYSAGMLDVQDESHMQALLVPLVDATPLVNALYVIPKSGPVFSLIMSGKGWHANSEVSVPSGRPDMAWYADVQEQAGSDHIIWSEYAPAQDDDLGGLIMARSTEDVVLALGVLNTDLAEFAANVPMRQSGILVHRSPTGRLAWFSTGNAFKTTESGDMLMAGVPEHVIIQAANTEWERLDSPFAEPFSFQHAGRTWWCTVHAIGAQKGHSDIMLIVPADDLSLSMEQTASQILMLEIVLAALAVVAVVVLIIDVRSRWLRYGRRQTPLDAAAIKRLIAAGESAQVEFKSTMRWNLHTNKADKNIEFAWLKTVAAFLNTDGGHILLGVADDGAVLGLETDKFANHDKCLLHFNNLIKQHVGLEFSGFINGDIRQVSERFVFVIQCDPCPKPVFIKHNGKEEFYIRVGPSSRQLPGSKTLEYMQARQG